MSQEENRQENLEEMHESDLTPKQRRQLEWQRVKGMSWGQRLAFFWDYYKWVLVVLVVAIIVVHEGIGIYTRLQQTTLLSMAIMDVSLGAQESVDQLAEDLALAIGTGDEKEVVDIDSSLVSGDSVAATSKLMVVTAAGITDVIFVDEATYEKLSEQEAFRDWHEILGDSYSQYESIFDQEGRFDVSQNEKWQSYGMTYYEPVYCGMLGSSGNLEATARMVEFFTTES